jgi:exodeoxyribonuclease VII large subunit
MGYWKEPLSVTELTRRIKKSLDESFGTVCLKGEISNLKRHSSGHTYFTLKDENAQIAAVLWRSRAGLMPVHPEDGMKVVMTGRLSVYEARGVYQVEVFSINPLGIGELQQLYEQLKTRLREEGLFDIQHKKEIPAYPERIGLITSPTGAAVRDMVNVIRRRFPPACIILSPVRVQGRGASSEIAGALRRFNLENNVDVVILGRGGGSFEDLWPFNEEIVARAIHGSAIPVISAVGHETDFTISDFVADLRAPTPSAAAELVVPDKSAILDNLRKHYYTMVRLVQVKLEEQRGGIRQILRSHTFNKPLDYLQQSFQRVDDLERSLSSLMKHRLTLLKSSARSLDLRLLALSPRATLTRGYAIVYRDNRVVTAAADLATGDMLRTVFHDGAIRSVVSGDDR